MQTVCGRVKSFCTNSRPYIWLRLLVISCLTWPGTQSLYLWERVQPYFQPVWNWLGNFWLLLWPHIRPFATSLNREVIILALLLVGGLNSLLGLDVWSRFYEHGFWASVVFLICFSLVLPILAISAPLHALYLCGLSVYKFIWALKNLMESTVPIWGYDVGVWRIVLVLSVWLYSFVWGRKRAMVRAAALAGNQV